MFSSFHAGERINLEKLMDPIESVDNNGLETSKLNSHVNHGWNKVVSRKQKPADQSAMVDAYVEDESSGAGEARSKRRSNCYGGGGYDFDDSKEEIATRDENLKAEETKKPKPKKERKPKVSLSEAAAKIDPSDLAAFLVKISKSYAYEPEVQLLRFIEYLERTLSAVQFPWANMFKESPLPKLIDVIDVPLSQIPDPVYKTSVDWINHLPLMTLCGFVLWAFNHILTYLAAAQLGHTKGGEKAAQHTSSKSRVAIFVALAMVLRNRPNALAIVLPTLREKRKYQGHDKLPITVWMMAQASQGDLSVGLYSWSRNLLPLVGSNPQSRDLILQLVEKILSNQNARTILVDGAVEEGPRLIPPLSFEILLRLTFPASSARVKATERFEAIYPLLKEVALAGASGSKLMKQVTEQIFTFSLKLAGEGNPVLAKEATAIAIWSVTENVDCCRLWENLYEENEEASVAVLKKLVDEWKDHSLKLSSSPSDTLTLSGTMESLRLKNEKAITEGGANGSLYKEADKSCRVISGRLSRGSGCLKGTSITVVVLAAAVVLSSNLEATSVLKKLVDSVDLHLYFNAIITALKN